MPTWVPPVSNANSVTYGGVGYFYMEERLSTGAPLGVADTMHKISYIDDITITRTASDDAADEVTAVTNSGQTLTAKRAYTPSASSSQTAPDIVVTFNMLESSAEHFDFYNLTKDRYFIVALPLGTHYAGAVAEVLDYFIFCTITTGGAINVSGAEVTKIPVECVVETNTVAATSASITDANMGTGAAFTATIAQYAGEKMMVNGA